jgi:Protein of unknown function (DUF1566)
MKAFAMTIRSLFALLLFAVSTCTFADAPFTVSTDGQEVTDSKTGLTWRRCAEGMNANVSGCTGTAVTYSHEAALALSNTQSGWRLPNVKELNSIFDVNRQNPAIDGAAFPATPSASFWSSTPYLTGGETSSQIAWQVSFNNGLVTSGARFVNRYVRLVRAGP